MPPEEHKQSFLSEILNFALIALVVVLPIRMFIAQPFIVSGASMETTFSTGEYLIVDQVSYRFEEPERGDVIIFRYPKDPSKFFIKRIIGIPGDTLEIKGNVVTITNSEYPDGVILEEPYVLDMAPNTNLTETLGDDEYFVMGDNRDASSDSRMWGVLQRDKIVGRAFLRLYPFTEAGVFPGLYDIEREINNQSQIN
jgi:signal peptidase I